MHLRAIKLRGFKSFPEPVEVRLEPGVAVVVGPNGSGKSNVADALLWASGSLSPHELRAEKPDDVLFAGSPGHAPADHCEVELLFDNEDGAFPELDFSEISVTRRLHRGGEGQYLVNRAAVRRTDLVELLADVGLGGSHGSVISQGKVEQILASKPEERRALIEDAAGLGKFKRRRHRAELKLARVQIQVERARDLEAEVKARLRPLALQATAAERAEKLRGEIAALRARLAQLDLAGIDDRLAEVEERRTAAALERRRTGERLEALLAERNRVEEELAAAAGRGDGATSALYRLRSASERLELRRDAGRELAERLRAEPLPRMRANPEREALREQARLARERLAALERSLAEREGLPPAARALAEEGERLALSLLEVEAGYERAVAAALGARAAALVAADTPGALALVERARKAGLGDLAVLVPPRAGAGRAARPPLLGAEALSSRVRARPGGERVAELLADVWLAEPAELTRAESGVLVTREGHCFDAARGELWFAGETAEAVLLQLDARRRALAAEADDLERRVEGLPAQVEPLPTGPLAELADRLAGALSAASAAAERFEAPLRARVDAGATRAGELAAELRRLGGEEAEVRRAAAEAGERASAIDVERAHLEEQAAEARRRLEEAGAEPAEGDDGDELAARVERLERRRETLGQVNPLAKEEYEREKERLTELAEQRADLEASLKELEELRAELAETVERRFDETFAAVSSHFEEVAATLFPGGTGRLRLTEPVEDAEDAEPGVEVELRPVGKRVTRLSLLSGGEKALGAISFLFALFLARPCPFYLLDEVEAALDDANIGRFVELLRRYSDRAQFIVVTHQKKTMEAADVLYGVTMGGDGVSQIVSRRLPRDEQVPAVA
ncbi:MAG TPA: AAA family ATPase [Gaiellaceae bacterium]|nr:AAA family ATPase [Gaiellaceae bacterium]